MNRADEEDGEKRSFTNKIKKGSDSLNNSRKQSIRVSVYCFILCFSALRLGYLFYLLFGRVFFFSSFDWNVTKKKGRGEFPERHTQTQEKNTNRNRIGELVIPTTSDRKVIGTTVRSSSWIGTGLGRLWELLTTQCDVRSFVPFFSTPLSIHKTNQPSPTPLPTHPCYPPAAAATVVSLLEYTSTVNYRTG